MTPSAKPERERLQVAVACGMLTLVLYAASLFPGVGGLVNHGDSAKFQFLGVVAGVGHAPGNPLYLALLWIVQHLPFGGEPWARANALSAVCAALTVGLLADATHRLGGRLAAIAASVSLALGGLFWIFGTEAEVYALAAVFLAAALDALVIAAETSSGAALGAALALFAVGLGSHLSLAFALPALLITTLVLHVAGAHLHLRSLVPATLASSFTLLLYAAIPYAHARGLAYSEYGESLDLRGLLAFVGAERFRSALVLPTLEQALHERPRAMMAILDRQWILPIWFVVPLGFVALARRCASLAVFVALASIGWLAFAFLYAIPDPEGFYVPLVVVSALLLGLAVAAAPRPGVALVFLVALLLPGAVLTQQTRAATSRFDVLEDVGYGIDPEPLDLPDLVRRIPAGAALAMPCAHYGCVEVTNYYRFADTTARARRIEIVTIVGGTPYPLPSPPPAIEADVARTRVVCTVHVEERALLASRGAQMRVIERPGELPIYCSVP